jgi:hypothetical protein
LSLLSLNLLLDATVKVATSLGARVISARAGRSHQMNLGANVAKGKILGVA